MEKYTLTINCEFINEVGILVNHTLKADAFTKPQIEDKYMFISKHHFKPIVIRIQQVIDYLLSGTEVICSGEEVDELDNIREAFYARFTIE
ncbi:DUF5952 family protein [Chitinophaga pinensis]|uniref:Uncharacterized protein n=1 Tax=Chitinophaga pinensis (strain ATCC 43595 / DSM 2588 / LMG 13176 / NBRC 15968 / NCIMB 11800 / UQM 2034) TaxID=485918 RepID=A0A979GV00_CHIPD|nr:DUF5952 family protein [Chitinophaga pinensis]ACU61069.1 hypothetical protein Cpin_3607 [Chitinophaga pinensis DSM 2588]